MKGGDQMVVHNTFYVTVKGMNRADELLSHYGNPGHFDLHDACITFVATSDGQGVTSEYFVDEFDAVIPGLTYASTKDMMNQLIDEKIFTPWRTSRCPHLPIPHN